MPYVLKTTSSGERIAVCDGTIIAISERGDAYSLTIKLDNGKIMSGFRGKSLGKPAMYDEDGKPAVHSFYQKESDYLEYGNIGSWNIGFPAVSDDNPFA